MSPAYVSDEFLDGSDSAGQSVPVVVVVDPNFDNYKSLAESAKRGTLRLYFRSSGAEAYKLARRLRVDAWLVAPELDDIAGTDFIELLQSRLGGSRLAVVETAVPGSSRWCETSRAANDTGADATLAAPITFGDLEQLLGLPVEERGMVLNEASPARMLVTLPVGVSAAAVAIAVLMLT